MGFRPDLLVTAPEEPRPALVVETKLRLIDLAATEAALKEYMVNMQCPVGLLITPERIRIYRDLYTGRTSASVDCVADYDATELWDQPPPQTALEFEEFVQLWLERLAQQSRRFLPKGVHDEFQQYVLPALTEGELRAAHPRTRT